MWKIIRPVSLIIATTLLISCTADNKAQNSDPITTSKIESSDNSTKMTSEIMAEIIGRFDEDAEITQNSISFTLRERDMILVFDKSADRMRVMTPIIQEAAVPEQINGRMLQANFDAVLDARYAIANDVVWAAYIHKLSSLTESDLRSGIAQVYTAAETFGTTYTSGAIVFGGGDTNSIHQDLLKELESLPDENNTGI